LVVTEAGQATSRRRLLAGVCGGAIGLAACGSSHSTTTTPLRKLPNPLRTADIEVLNALLDVENRSVAAYEAGIPLLSGSVATAAKQFLGQDLTHTGELAGLVKEAGGDPIKIRPSYNLGHPRNAAEVLILLHTVESDVVAAYVASIPRLSEGQLRADVASLLGNDAQHLSMLNAALGRPPIPSALVTGRE
jgi:Ferritin-like domain